MNNEVVVQDDRITALLPGDLMGYDDAVRQALEERAKEERDAEEGEGRGKEDEGEEQKAHKSTEQAPTDQAAEPTEAGTDQTRPEQDAAAR